MISFYHNYKSSILFTLKVVILYLLWFPLYDNYLSEIIDPWLTQRITLDTATILNLIGYKVHVLIQHTYGSLGYENKSLGIAYMCNGLILWVVFILFILSYTGPIKHKLWFIPLGVIGIYIINVLRCVSLVIIHIHKPEYLAFNHKYTFTLAVYSFIILLWAIWINYFCNDKK
jgi:exosortase family protein XrtF